MSAVGQFDASVVRGARALRGVSLGVLLLTLASACADGPARPLALTLDSHSAVFAPDAAAAARLAAAMPLRPRPERLAPARPVTRRLHVAALRRPQPLGASMQRGAAPVTLALGLTPLSDPLKTARDRSRAERGAVARSVRALGVAAARIAGLTCVAHTAGEWWTFDEPDPHRLPSRGPPHV